MKYAETYGRCALNEFNNSIQLLNLDPEPTRLAALYTYGNRCPVEVMYYSNKQVNTKLKGYPPCLGHPLAPLDMFPYDK